MKTTYKFLPAIAALAFMGSCNDLDTEPMGGTITSDQKEEVVANDPSMAEASVNGLPMMTKQFCGIMDDTGYQSDFGWPSCMLLMDTRTADMPAPGTGYNWFSAPLDYSDRTDNTLPTR